MAAEICIVRRLAIRYSPRLVVVCVAYCMAGILGYYTVSQTYFTNSRLTSRLREETSTFSFSVANSTQHDVKRDSVSSAHSLDIARSISTSTGTNLIHFSESTSSTDASNDTSSVHSTESTRVTNSNMSSVQSKESYRSKSTSSVNSTDKISTNTPEHSEDSTGPTSTFSAHSNTSAAQTSQLLVTTQTEGRLGNHMFQYASLLGIAHRNGRIPIFPKSCLLHRPFHITHLADKIDEQNFTVLNEKFYASYDRSFEHLPNVNVKLARFLQSWKYFHNIRDTIKRELTFQQQFQDAATQLLDTHLERIGNRTRIGLHIRRADMASAGLQKMGYHTAPSSYVIKAMQHMRQKFGDVIFLVFSTDISWCNTVLKGVTDYIMVGRASAEVHMALLVSCDHVIMTVGTYGWWGGYLSGGDVVYYWDKECLHSPPLPVEIRTPEDYFPPEWTAIPA